MLPTRDRPGLAPPYLVINLVPQTSWGRNLRAMMGRDAWRAFVKEHVYPSTGSVCRICGGRGPEWPVEADEVWRYDEGSGIQTLHAIVPLCPACHEVRTAGFAISNDRRREVARHLAWVERIRVDQAGRRIDEAMATWQTRSKRTWKIDLSHMATRYGIHISHTASATDAVSGSLVAEASARASMTVRTGVGAREAAAIMTGRRWR